MLLKEQWPSTHTPVPLRELAAHLRRASGFADDGSEDGLLELYLRNATSQIEQRTGQALVSRPYVLQVGSWDRNGHLTLPVGPVAMIDQIQFISPSSTVDLDPEDWVLMPGTTRQLLQGTGSGPLWPIPHGAVAKIHFVAGYGQTWNDVPADLRQAILTLAAHLYENRYGELPLDQGMPYGVLSVVEQNRPVRI